MASEARRSRAVLVTPIRPGSRLGVQPRLSSAVRSVRRVYTSFSADMPWPRGPEDELLSGLLVLPSLPMDSWRCDEGTAL